MFVMQWLALDKEAKKLSVETTPNQVKVLILTWTIVFLKDSLYSLHTNLQFSSFLPLSCYAANACWKNQYAVKDNHISERAIFLSALYRCKDHRVVTAM